MISYCILTIIDLFVEWSSPNPRGHWRIQLYYLRMILTQRAVGPHPVYMRLTERSDSIIWINEGKRDKTCFVIGTTFREAFKLVTNPLDSKGRLCKIVFQGIRDAARGPFIKMNTRYGALFRALFGSCSHRATVEAKDALWSVTGSPFPVSRGKNYSSYRYVRREPAVCRISLDRNSWSRNIIRMKRTGLVCSAIGIPRGERIEWEELISE